MNIEAYVQLLHAMVLLLKSLRPNSSDKVEGHACMRVRAFFGFFFFFYLLI